MDGVHGQVAWGKASALFPFSITSRILDTCGIAWLRSWTVGFSILWKVQTNKIYVKNIILQKNPTKSVLNYVYCLILINFETICASMIVICNSVMKKHILCAIAILVKIYPKIIWHCVQLHRCKNRFYE